MQLEAIQDLHRSIIAAAHRGVRTTYNHAIRYYKFKGLKNKVSEVLKKCDICKKTKDKRHRPYRILQPIPVPERNWHTVIFNHITDLPKSKDPLTGKNFNSIFIIVDKLSKQAYFLPHEKAHTAENLAHLYIRYIFAKHGMPKEIILDRGSTFTSKF